MTAVESTNARTGEISQLANVREATDRDVDVAVGNAAALAADLARQSPTERSAMLHSVADAIEAARHELVEAADFETALGEERLHAEVGRTAGQFRMFAEVAAEASYLGVRIDHGNRDGAELRTLLSPIGVVAVFGASNFPLAFSVPGGDTASALAAGCPVVVKAHPAHPTTCEASLAALRSGLEAAGMAGGLVGLVHGFEAGRYLVSEADVKAVGFTGSEAVGMKLHNMATARPHPIPFYGELGSLNPVVVMADTDPVAFAAALASSMTLGAGQFCTKPGLVFAPVSLADEIYTTTTEALTRAGEFTMLTHQIAENYQRTIDGLNPTLDVWQATSNGVGASLVTVDASDLHRYPALTKECFGPTTVLARYGDEVELLAELESLEGSLTGTVHGRDLANARKVVECLAARVGRVVWNGFPTGVRVAWATHHGGPFPASTSSAQTSVGAAAIARWLRPVCYQDIPDPLLPPSLRDSNPWGIPQRVNGTLRPGVSS